MRQNPETQLSPAYDLHSTLPYGDQSMALQLDSRDKRLTRQHFIDFGQRVGVRKAAIVSMLNSLCTSLNPWLSQLPEIGLSVKQTTHLRKTMEQRLQSLAVS